MRRARGRLLGRAACFLAFALMAGIRAATSGAGDDPDPDFSLDDTVPAGPFHLAPFFVIKDLGYDDNVRLDAARPSGDYTVTFGPGARAVAPLGRMAALSIWDEIDYAVFARESDLNHVNNSLRTKLHVYLRDITLFADGRQDSLRERPNTEIDLRIRNTTTQGRFGLSWRLSGRGRADLYIRRIGLHYDPGRPEVQEEANPNFDPNLGDIVAANLERDETQFGLEGRLRVRPRTSLLLDLRAGRIDFDRTEPQRDSASGSAMAGVEFDPAGALHGHLKLGARHLSPEDDAVDGFSGFVADASLGARIAGRGELRAVYERDTGFSVLGENLFYIQERRGLSYEHYLSSRVSLKLGRQLDDVDYPLDVRDPDGGDFKHRRDDILWDTVSVRYRFGPSLRVGLSVGRWERDSTIDSEDTKRTTITTLMEYKP